MNRRSFLHGAVVLAPAVILTPGLLMPVRSYGISPVAAALPDVMTATEVLARRYEFLQHNRAYYEFLWSQARDAFTGPLVLPASRVLGAY